MSLSVKKRSVSRRTCSTGSGLNVDPEAALGIDCTCPSSEGCGSSTGGITIKGIGLGGIVGTKPGGIVAQRVG